jgi:hypothetical protein
VTLHVLVFETDRSWPAQPILGNELLHIEIDRHAAQAPEAKGRSASLITAGAANNDLRLLQGEEDFTIQ